MRRLPVINSTAPEDDAAAARPRWQWILIGAGFTAAFWIPAALVLFPLAAPLVGALAALPLIATFVAAAAGAGAVLGRFATRSKPGDAAWAAVSCAAALAAVSAPKSAWLAILAFVVLGPAGAAGAYLGSRRYAARRSHGRP